MRLWLVERGYSDTNLPRGVGVSHNEEFTGRLLSISMWLDRRRDWYVELRPLGGTVRWRSLGEWGRCIGVNIEDDVYLEPQLLALRQHLDDFEAMCGEDRLAETVGCLRRGSRVVPAN